MKQLLYCATLVLLVGAIARAEDSAAPADETAAPPSHYEHLKELDWLVGRWVDADSNAVVETVCDWTQNKNFLTRKFTVTIDGEIDLAGTQVVGYDASTGKIRSWMFDTAGGIGEGAWTQKDNGWVIKKSQVLISGEKASSINVITKVDDNTLTWQSVHRVIGGEMLPDVGPIKIVKEQ